MSVIPANRNGLAFSDQPGMTVVYFLSYCAHYSEGQKRAREMRDEGDSQWAYVELMALCYRDLAVAQGNQYRTECSVAPQSRAWLERIGIPAATDEQIAALRDQDAEDGRYSLALAAVEDYFRAMATDDTGGDK